MKFLVAVFWLAATVAHAAPLERSLRPLARPEVASTSPATKTPAAEVTVLRSLRPKARPSEVRQRGQRAKQLQAQGAICNNPEIKGEAIGRVRAQISGCGIESAVRVRSVSGIPLSPAAVMDCTTALTLSHWVSKSAIPRLQGRGGGLASLRVIGHYACRPRNNRPGARISEHGKGRAIDISEFRLKDGDTISVLRDWNTKKGFEPLREMHRDACGIFGTVLGPKADRFHQDHFHFDTARHRSGTYCR